MNVTAQKDPSGDTPVKRHRLRLTLLILLGVLILALLWFGFTAHPEVTALRNIVHYKVIEALGGPRVRTGEPAGSAAYSTKAGTQLGFSCALRFSTSSRPFLSWRLSAAFSRSPSIGALPQ